jgi:hypothetical protein
MTNHTNVIYASCKIILFFSIAAVVSQGNHIVFSSVHQAFNPFGVGCCGSMLPTGFTRGYSNCTPPEYVDASTV